MKKYYVADRIPLVTVLLVLLFTDFLFSAEKSRVKIAIAANLVPAVAEIKKIFEADNPGVNLEIISGASGNLTAQIINGAPYDIFASADMDFPWKLKSEGLTSEGPDVYAEGFMVLFTVKNINIKNGISLVNDGQIKKISIANPDTAPYGKAAINALKKAGLYDGAVKKLVYAGNVSQAAQYIIIGADIGFVSRSNMFDSSMLNYKENVNWVALPEEIAMPLKQGVVLLKKSGNNQDAVKAYRFILSSKAKAVFAKYGYR
jgi:molybdate transport system substrate-binding protein